MTDGASSAMAALRPIYQRMESKITQALRPSMLRIIDESHKHAGHSGNPSGDPDAETHFNVAVVSEEFAGKRMVERHRIVYGIVDQEIKDGVHALSLKTKTMEEAKKEGMLPADHPTCKD